MQLGKRRRSHYEGGCWHRAELCNRRVLGVEKVCLATLKALKAAFECCFEGNLSVTDVKVSKFLKLNSTFTFIQRYFDKFIICMCRDFHHFFNHSAEFIRKDWIIISCHNFCPCFIRLPTGDSLFHLKY